MINQRLTEIAVPEVAKRMRGSLSIVIKNKFTSELKQYEKTNGTESRRGKVEKKVSKLSSLMSQGSPVRTGGKASTFDLTNMAREDDRDFQTTFKNKKVHMKEVSLDNL
jgi:hypothetical protein